MGRHYSTREIFAAGGAFVLRAGRQGVELTGDRTPEKEKRVKKGLIAITALLVCSFASSAFAWNIGGCQTCSNRKIVRVFTEIKQGQPTFAAFVLSYEGGSGVSNDAVIIHDLGSATTQAMYQDLLKVYEHGDTITQLYNTSRSSDTGNWANITTFYRVYAGDNFYYWHAKSN
jgi:hypothetical protein